MRQVFNVLLVCSILALVVGCGTSRQQTEKDRDKSAAREETSSSTAQQETTISTTRSTPEQTRREENNVGERATTTETTTGAKKETPEEATVKATATEGEDSGAASGGEAPFSAAAEDQGGQAGAAQGIAEIRYGAHEGYERLVIEFESQSGPSSGVPEWKFSSPAGDGYSRITFPGLQATAVSGGRTGGGIMDDFYAVRAPGGGFFVDIFATGAFQYRLLELNNPGRLAIDYRPAGVQLSLPLPVRGEKNVVMQPRSGEAVGNPLTVSGYSRNFEGSTSIILRSAGGEILAQKTVQANDWAETWGYFDAALEVPAFQGEGTLQVGSQSARDGTFEGVEVPVSYGGG